MSEQPAGWYIPGDEVSVDIGHFEHRQHLLYVVAVYSNRPDPVNDDTANVIELEGTPETAGPVMEPTPSERWFNSRATLSTTIHEDTSPGRYSFIVMRGHTYGGQQVPFDWEPQKMEMRGIPTYIEVRAEPSTEPRLM